jgi:putative ABC transport system permease protein
VFVFRTLWRSIAPRRHSDVEEEFLSTLDAYQQDLIRQGLSKEEASRKARIDLGQPATQSETYREAIGLRAFDELSGDIRYGLRGFRRNPLFAVIVVVTLALAIGVSTAVFSVADRILFRPLPYAHPDRLVSIGLRHSVEPYEFMMGSFFYDWRDNQTPFAAITAQAAMPQPCDLTERNPLRLICNYAHGNLLPTLGVAPVLGRDFLPGDMLPDAPRTALLSYHLWQSRYHRDPAILNQLLQIDDAPARIIGVLPPDFEMPSGQPADVLLARQIDVAAVRSGTQPETMRAFARLKPGVTIAQARAALEPLFQQSLRWAPAPFRKDIHLELRSLRDRQMHDVIPAAWIMLSAVLAVLLIACANVASLFVTRAAAREREFAVRAALGAGRGRLVRQALTESLLLSIAGGSLGCALAAVLLRVFIAIAPPDMPFLHKATLDLRILAAALTFSLLSGIVCGILPAWQRPRFIALAARATRPGAQAALRRVLVIAQIACSVLLLSGASLLLRSFRNMEQQRLGMDTSGILTANITLSRARYGTQQKQMDFFLRAESALRGLPGISAAVITDALPLSQRGRRWYSAISIAGKPPLESGGGIVISRFVTPGYFTALDIPILRGRAFTQDDADGKADLLILSSQLATRIFPNQDPIGQRVRLDPGGPFYSVIGVAANVRNNGLTAPNEPEYYRLLRNTTHDWGREETLILRSALPPTSIAPWVRQQIAAMDPTTPIEIQTLDQHIRTLADQPRFETALLGFFALTGLLMAVIGLYGVTAYAATQRTQEIGVRIALGATRFNILRLITWEGARLILAERRWASSQRLPLRICCAACSSPSALTTRSASSQSLSCSPSSRSPQPSFPHARPCNSIP